MAVKKSLFEQTGRVGAVQQLRKLIGGDDEKKFEYYATDEYPLVNEDGDKTPKRFHKAYVENMRGYYNERGMQIPERFENVDSYLKDRTGSGERDGGTRMPKKHIMELPTNSSQKRRK